MRSSENKTKGWKRFLRSGWLPLLVVPMVMTAWAFYAVNSLEAEPGANGGWGSEMLAGVHEGIVAASPIGIANACGLGASSCFKCHNGQRAAKPGPQPWHEQHADVNHSCAGCHQGNERLMVKGIAHRDLLADPRADAEKACMTCHSSDEAGELLSRYQNIQ